MNTLLYRINIQGFTNLTTFNLIIGLNEYKFLSWPVAYKAVLASYKHHFVSKGKLTLSSVQVYTHLQIQSSAYTL